MVKKNSRTPVEFEALPSTQQFLKMHIEAYKSCIIIALEQTAGIGKFQRHWNSPKGGIWFSFAIQIINPLESYYLLTSVIGVSIITALNDLILVKTEADFLQYKWPNDIYFKGKKVAGVLVEVVDDQFVIGIGINTVFSAKDYEFIDIIENSVEKRRNVVMQIIEEIEKCVSLYCDSDNFDTLRVALQANNFLENKTLFIKNHPYKFKGFLKQGGIEIVSNLTGKTEILQHSEYTVDNKISCIL